MNKKDRWFRPRIESVIVEEEVEAFCNDLEDDIEVNICDLRDMMLKELNHVFKKVCPKMTLM